MVEENPVERRQEVRARLQVMVHCAELTKIEKLSGVDCNRRRECKWISLLLQRVLDTHSTVEVHVTGGGQRGESAVRKWRT